MPVEFIRDRRVVDPTDAAEIVMVKWRLARHAQGRRDCAR